MTPNSSPKKPTASRAWIIAAIVLVLGFDLAFLWQRRAGATESELGGHPDEAAHYITGLAAANYLAHDLGTSPEKSFAEFSKHYPIVRPVGQSPVFAFVEGAWTFAFGKSRSSMLMMMCFCAALVGLLIHLAVRNEFGEAAGAIAATLFLSLPLVREHTATLLPAMLCTAFMFAAAIAFTRFLERKNWSDALLFGTTALLAMLADRAGWAILLFLPLAIPMPRKWRWLLPLVMLVAMEVWRTIVGSARGTLAFYATQLAAALGVILLLITVPSLIRKIARPTERTPFWNCAAALLIGVLLFATLAPGELDPARLLPAIPAAILFVVAGCAAIAKRLGRSTGFILLIAGVLTLVLSETVMVTWRAKKWSGFHSLAEIVLNSGDHPQARILVCSDPTGEGMFISEIAMGEARPARLIERADHLFANTKFTDDEDLANLVGARHFDYIVFDESNPDLDHSTQHDTLRRVLRENSDRFWEMSSSPVIRDGIAQDSPVRLYRVTGRD